MKMQNSILFTIMFLVATLSYAQMDCSDGRYSTKVFTGNTKTSNILYGNNFNLDGSSQDLFLDVYEPTGDSLTLRPLIIMAHGGSFIGGDKTDGCTDPICIELSNYGYVTASINYRIGMGFPVNEESATRAVYRATHDARAAVRFFRKDFAENGNTYGIDTSQIYFGGQSAGAFMAIHMAYLNDTSELPPLVDTTEIGMGGGMEGNSGNPGYSSRVNAIINMAGALADTAFMEPNDVPIISFHGDMDGTVPFGTDIIYVLGFPLMEVDGSASIAEQADKLGVINCFKPYYGQNHVPECSNTAYFDTSLAYIKNWMLQFVCSGPDICSYYEQCNVNGVMSNTDESVMGAGDGTASVSITGGVAPYTYLWSSGDSTSSITGLSSGAYQVTVTESTGCVYIGSVAINTPGCTISLSLGGSAETISGANDGTATVTIMNGAAPYSILWSTSDTDTVMISSLAPGNYSVVVTDSAGCVATGNYTVEGGQVVGVPTQSEKTVRIMVYPNPASGSVTFKLMDYQSTIISIYNLAGVRIKRIYAKESITKVPIHDLAPGLYFFQLNNPVNGKFSNGKFVVARQ